VFFSDVHAQPLLALGRSGLLEEIGEDHFFGDIDEALGEARRHLGLSVEAITAPVATA
jgi:hypothetical protein